MILNKMDLHEKYTRFPTNNISILEVIEISFKDDPLTLLHHLVGSYNKEITKQDLDIKKLEIFRTVLCYEYQFLCQTNRTEIVSKARDVSLPDVEDILFPQKQVRSTLEASVLYDIILLQMMLYHDVEYVIQSLQKFHHNSSTYLISNYETRMLYMKTMECFLEALNFHKFPDKNLRSDDFNNTTLTFIIALYLNDLKKWFKVKEPTEWQSLVTMISKLVSTFGTEVIPYSIWDFILENVNVLKESLTALIIVSDACFSTGANEVTDIYNDLYKADRFWLLILNGLKSNTQQYRKQALFLMKKSIDYLNKVQMKDTKLRKNTIIPFICDRSYKGDLSVTCMREKFFLVFEGLEEKQYHLVAPALSHVLTLIRGNQEHIECGDCFNIVWLHCIFQRILSHDNSTIVKWGLIKSCKLDMAVYNDEFLEIFIHVLNNTFMYECKPDSQPEVVKQLAALLVRAHERNVHLIKRFLIKVSQVAWGPVAIFHVIQSFQLALTYMKDYTLQLDELNAIKLLVSTNLNMHSHILRIASQIEILRMISECSIGINDLTLLANVLSTFPCKEAFQRGTLIWDSIKDWLGKILTEEDAVNFVTQACTKYSMENDTLEMNTKTFALMIFLLHDANLILHRKTCPTQTALCNWLLCFNTINMRPYANIIPCIKAVGFLAHSLDLCVPGNCDKIQRILSIYIDAALKFSIQNIKKISITLPYEDLNRYLPIISSLFNNGNLLMSNNKISNYVEQLINELISTLKNVLKYEITQYYSTLYMFYHCQNVITTKTMAFLDILFIQTMINNKHKVNLTGKIISDCYLLSSKLMYQCIRDVPVAEWPKNVNWFQRLEQIFELGGKEIISVIAKVLRVIVDKNAIKSSDDKESFERIFTMCWKCTFLNKKNNIFWPAIKNVIAVIANYNFLASFGDMNFVNQFIEELIEEGDNMPNLKKLLLVELELLDVQYLKKFQDPLLSCLLHEHVLRRDKRIENQTILYIAQNLKKYLLNCTSVLDYNNDSAITARSVMLVYKIINADGEYALQILSLLLEKLEKHKNKRYFNHSYLHKLKDRIMQALLILQPVLHETSTISLQETICNLILLESNQHSVRLMQEWILIRIFEKNYKLHPKLWIFFEESIVKRPGCTSSVASIFYHVAKLLPPNNQPDFIQVGMSFIARCCLGQQFNMRLYNQIIFVKLYTLLKSLNCDRMISEYKGLYQAIIENLQQENLTKNINRIQDDFYFTVFHPINDYSLQTIYYELPRLSDVSVDEWIASDLFEALNFQRNSHHPLQLYNSGDSLANIESSYLTNSSADDIESTTRDIEMNTGLSDIQKKIDPSKSLSLLCSERLTVVPSIEPQQEGLIVVASLIDCIPNLGGLARTCEIFGIKTLVIANLNHIKNKDFQSLSVSADKWITIIEMKPHQLQEYLLQKKDMGWSLVGAEQTANSRSLLEMKFEKRTVLILGNEKHGVPANLIPLFDVCVEIPQIGLTRSLNVHVTGAICIWQYVNQHILT